MTKTKGGKIKRISSALPPSNNELRIFHCTGPFRYFCTDETYTKMKNKQKHSRLRSLLAAIRMETA